MSTCYHAGLLQSTWASSIRAHSLEGYSKSSQCRVTGRRSTTLASTQHSAISAYCHGTDNANRQPRFAARAGPSDIDISSLLDDVDLPEIDADLASFQAEGGAVFDVSSKNKSRPLNYPVSYCSINIRNAERRHPNYI